MAFNQPKGPDPLLGDDPDVVTSEEGEIKEAKESLQMARQLTKVVDSAKDLSSGTKESPARRTCRHLALAHHPDFESVNYWIDPNQGSASDSFEADCGTKTMHTCVYAAPNQFTYTADASQFHFLQPLGSSAFQNVALHCRNTVAYYDASAKSYKKAAIFASMDNQEIGAGRRNHKYQVPTDERKNCMNVWGRSSPQKKQDAI